MKKPLKKWKLLQNETVLDSKWLKIYKNSYLLPKKLVIDDYYITEERDVSLIVSLDENYNTILTREYRPGIDDYSIELPAGFIEVNDDTLESAAMREYFEETGYKFKKLESMGRYYRSTGRSKDAVHYFLVREAYKANGPHLDESETLYSFTVPFKEALNMVKRGEIVQQSSVMGLLLAEQRLHATGEWSVICK